MTFFHLFLTFAILATSSTTSAQNYVLPVGVYDSIRDEVTRSATVRRPTRIERFWALKQSGGDQTKFWSFLLDQVLLSVGEMDREEHADLVGRLTVLDFRFLVERLRESELSVAPPDRDAEQRHLASGSRGLVYQEPGFELYKGGFFESRGIWNDRGTGASRNLCLRNTLPVAGEVFFGDVAQDNQECDGKVYAVTASVDVRAFEQDRPPIKKPVGWYRIWWDRGTGASSDVTLFRAACPAGYVAPGLIAVNGHLSTIRDNWISDRRGRKLLSGSYRRYRCLRKDLLKFAREARPVGQWKYRSKRYRKGGQSITLTFDPGGLFVNR